MKHSGPLLPVTGLLLLMACTPVARSTPWHCQPTADGIWDCQELDTTGTPDIPHPVPAATDTGRAGMVQPDRPAESAVPVAESTAGEPVRETPPAEDPGTTPAPAPAPSDTGRAEVTQPGQPGSDHAASTAPAVEAAAEAAADIPDSGPATVDSETFADPQPDRPAPDAPPLPSTAITADTTETSPQDTPDTDERWKLCPPLETGAAPPAPVAEGEDIVNMSADIAETSGDNLYTLQGNAVVEYGRKRLSADNIVYNETEGSVEARGDIRYVEPGLIVSGNRAVVYPGTDKGSLHEITYLLPRDHGRGKAEVVYLEGAHPQRLKKATYTTCPPGNRDWLLRASRVNIDHEEGMASARHAKLYLKDTPVMYTPYISFPIDDRRRSGFLLPRAGVSEQNGFDMSVPYYWNIAPNYDATLTPRHMSKRGLMMGGEFRYLHRKNNGVLSGEYLPSDNEFDNGDRHLVSFKHNGRPFQRLRTTIDASDVSDKDFLEDLGTNLTVTSVTHLRREAKAVYHGDWWTLDGRALDFQTVDPTIRPQNKPYKQLPRLRFNANPRQRPLGMQLGLDSELTEFDRDNSIEGQRVDVQPQVTLPLQSTAYYLKPSLGVRYTRYNLSNGATGDPDNPDRTTPIANMDAGMFFDRNFSLGTSDYVQTLEPRLYYLYVPNKDQDDLPVFDTGNYDFKFWTLFQDNRFSGPDRMGDANQLALALTTRVLNPATGIPHFTASIGELLYFRDRQVTLPGEPEETDDTSDIIGEVNMVLGKHWYANTELQWDPHETETTRYDALLQYKPAERQVVNLSYRFRRETLQQTDVTFLWPLGRHWHVAGRWNYSIDDSQTLDTVAGIGYESCCWGARLVGRSYVNDPDGERTNEIFLELELKGLASIGDNIDSILNRDILKYQASY